MREAERLAEELESVFDGSPWHADALMPILNNVGTRERKWTPSPGMHSITGLVTHLSFWKRTAVKRMNGEPCLDANDIDWDVATESSRWSVALAELVAAHQEVIARVRSLSARELSAVVTGGGTTVRSMVIGLGYHDVYHAGQIRLLQRLHAEATR